jgi:hypothetical protein
LLAAVVWIAAAAMAASLRADLPAPLVARGAARWLALATAPLLLAAAASPRARDRDEGIEALLAWRGAGSQALALGRVVAAVVAVTLRVALPGTLLCVALLPWAGPAIVAQLMIAMLGFACACGALLGGLAALSGELAGPRGRELFLLVMVLSWVAAELIAAPRWSIPGALDLGLDAIAAQGGSR